MCGELVGVITKGAGARKCSPDCRENRGRGSRGLSDVKFAAATVAPGGLDRVLVGLFKVISKQTAEDSRNQCQLGRKLLSSAIPR